MTNNITIFGEALFDCFKEEGGENCILGGAPFNICWHLQALGDKPTFVSRVGNDHLGKQILADAKSWGICTDHIQIDERHPTGKVQVRLHDNEPHYDIKIDSAYDFIAQEEIQLQSCSGILYHGSLALRSDYAKQQFAKWVEEGDWDIFLDVNLRAPWWDKESLFEWIAQARWVKLNIDELRELGFQQSDIKSAMQAFQAHFGNEQVIVTRGAEGVMVLTPAGFFCATPDKINHFMDTVGAGDAFTAIYMHGLVHQWPLKKILSNAQSFASRIIGIRGATPENHDFYQTLTA